jgi:chemotaxis protein MotB
MASNIEIIVKKVKKGGHEAHHGGAWKVAYADFVTAMMAFFLLLWLLNATTEEQRRGISDYFAPASVSHSQSGAGGLLGGRAISVPGAQVTGTSTPSVDVPLTPGEGESAADERGAERGGMVKSDKKTGEEEAAAARAGAQAEEERFADAERELKEAIQKSPELKGLEENLLIDKTPEGLRVQVVDQEGKPMFALGSAKPLERTVLLLAKISEVIQKLPNRISVTGHTDAIPYKGSAKGYSNWELSSERALSTRRSLVDSGLAQDRLAMVVGRASEEPLVAEDPNSPRNRRIAIVLLRDAQADKPGDAAAAATGAASPATTSSPARAPTPQFKRDWTGPRVQ